MVRVVRTAHGVKVVLFHQFDVAAQGGFIHHLAVFRMMLVAIHPSDQQRLTVNLQQAVTDFHAAEADIAGLHFQQVPLSVAQCDR
ncbi:hypothetical protein D3C76_975630 [compost metagenome]